MNYGCVMLKLFEFIIVQMCGGVVESTYCVVVVLCCADGVVELVIGDEFVIMWCSVVKLF